jgi:hypothetical protein
LYRYAARVVPDLGARAQPDGDGDDDPPIGTALTASVETIDRDAAGVLLRVVGV